MGLTDRSYMRDDGSRGFPPVPAWLAILILNVVVFFVEYSHGANSRFFERMMEYGALSLDGIRSGAVWQLLTFQFLHLGMSHLLFNSIVLYSFGRTMEMLLGKRSFLTLYFLSGTAGGILQILLGLIWPSLGGAVVGASAGLCGLVACFSLLNPNSSIYLFFILPIRAIYFLPLTLILTVLAMIVPASEGGVQIANGAHLGGLLAGIAYAKWGGSLQSQLSRWRPFQDRRRRRDLIKAASFKSRWSGSSGDSYSSPEPEEFISREVDPILDKISAHGIQSLTERERKILEAARNRMVKR